MLAKIQITKKPMLNSNSIVDKKKNICASISHKIYTYHDDKEEQQYHIINHNKNKNERNSPARLINSPIRGMQKSPSKSYTNLGNNPKMTKTKSSINIGHQSENQKNHKVQQQQPFQQIQQHQINQHLQQQIQQQLRLNKLERRNESISKSTKFLQPKGRTQSQADMPKISYQSIILQKSNQHHHRQTIDNHNNINQEFHPQKRMNSYSHSPDGPTKTKSIEKISIINKQIPKEKRLQNSPTTILNKSMHYKHIINKNQKINAKTNPTKSKNGLNNSMVATSTNHLIAKTDQSFTNLSVKKFRSKPGGLPSKNLNNSAIMNSENISPVCSTSHTPTKNINQFKTPDILYHEGVIHELNEKLQNLEKKLNFYIERDKQKMYEEERQKIDNRVTITPILWNESIEMSNFITDDDGQPSFRNLNVFAQRDMNQIDNLDITIRSSKDYKLPKHNIFSNGINDIEITNENNENKYCIRNVGNNSNNAMMKSQTPTLDCISQRKTNFFENNIENTDVYTKKEENRELRNHVVKPKSILKNSLQTSVLSKVSSSAVINKRYQIMAVDNFSFQNSHNTSCSNKSKDDPWQSESSYNYDTGKRFGALYESEKRFDTITNDSFMSKSEKSMSPEKNQIQ